MIAKCVPIFLAALGVASIHSTALVQGNTFNPYGNSGYADYREFGSPMVSNNAALPGQALLNNTPMVSRPRANTFQDYTNDIDGIDSSAVRGGRSAGNSVPYYLAYQRLNGEYNRVYKPNAKADEGFYERQKAREQKYAQAMAERDPAKRAKLLREVERESFSSVSATKATTKASANIPKASATGSAPATRSTAPTERRMPAPSPFTDNRPLSRSTPPPPTRPSTTTPSRAAANAARARAAAPAATTAPAPPPQ